MSKHRKKGGNSHQRRVARRFNRHHIVNKCHNGPAIENNLLVMDIDRHNAWHKIFKNLSFLEVIRLLARCLKMKHHPDSDEAQSIIEEIRDDDHTV